MKNYAEILYKILFEFDFEGVREATTMPVAVATLMWTSLFLFFAKNSLKTGFGAEARFIFSMFFYLFGILLVWFLTAIFFEFIAKIFSKAGKVRTLLTLSSYSLLPYIFIAPFELIKKFSSVGYFLGTKLEILLFFWVIFIYAKALEKTYALEKASSYMLVFLPLISLFFAFIWLIGSAFNLGYIYSV